MDPLNNPFSPGAGNPPPELAGRDELRSSVAFALRRTRRGLSAKSVLMVGLRGVGKTVLLDQLRDDAEADGMHTIRIEAPEGRSLPALLAPELRSAFIRLSRTERGRDAAIRALRALAGFVQGLKVQYNDIQVTLDFEPEPGLADNGDLEHDLQELIEAAGAAARAADTALAIFIDELQYVAETELSALIVGLHRVAQARLPVILVGAGLPQLPARMGNAKSYAERLFEFPTLEPLTPAAARLAIAVPFRAAEIVINDDALELIYARTQGYPYFLQEWGKHTWDVAAGSPVTKAEVEIASARAIAGLDANFFRVRFDRLTPTERRFLRAMAELGPGPHRSGDIARLLGRAVTAIAPTRAKLIEKGMIWSPSHGDTAFTVPLFDEFMKRTIPGKDWLTE